MSAHGARYVELRKRERGNRWKQRVSDEVDQTQDLRRMVGGGSRRDGHRHGQSPQTKTVSRKGARQAAEQSASKGQKGRGEADSRMANVGRRDVGQSRSSRDRETAPGGQGRSEGLGQRPKKEAMPQVDVVVGRDQRAFEGCVAPYDSNAFQMLHPPVNASAATYTATYVQRGAWRVGRRSSR